MLFVLRLVAAPRGQGYRATLRELWEQCAAAGVELHQDGPPAASTAGEAREKLDERAFRALRREILANSRDGRLWRGHRVLAFDGSRISLPRELASRGYFIPNGARHPQGLLSVMYRLDDRIPVDFDLFRHENERKAAPTHLDQAAEGDVTVYDRGCFSFAMALAHWQRGTHFVCRIARSSSPAFDAFIASRKTDQTVTLQPPRDGPPSPSRRNRLAKYAIADTEFCLATSLLDSDRYPIPALSDLCHGGSRNSTDPARP